MRPFSTTIQGMNAFKQNLYALETNVEKFDVV